jgi:hypothetical protein
LGGGNNGSISFLSSSSSIGFAMIAPPCAFMASAIYLQAHEPFC